MFRSPLFIQRILKGVLISGAMGLASIHPGWIEASLAKEPQFQQSPPPSSQQSPPPSSQQSPPPSSQQSPPPSSQPLPVSPCKMGMFAKVELYFGLSKPTGGTVTEAEWQSFLDRVVTPNFQDGLTVVNGRGQYLNRAGAIVIESSKVLVLIYPVTDISKINPMKERSLTHIINTYKKNFAQESVLRVTHCVQATF